MTSSEQMLFFICFPIAYLASYYRIGSYSFLQFYLLIQRIMTLLYVRICVYVYVANRLGIFFSVRTINNARRTDHCSVHSFVNASLRDSRLLRQDLKNGLETYVPGRAAQETALRGSCCTRLETSSPSPAPRDQRSPCRGHVKLVGEAIHVVQG